MEMWKAVVFSAAAALAAAGRLTVEGFGGQEFPDREVCASHALPPPSGKNWRMTLLPGGAGASNRVEAAFGLDASGDGGLSPDETSVAAGFDRGEWYLLGGPWLEGRWTAPARGGALVLDIRLSASGETLGFSFRDGGGALSFAGLPPKAAFLRPSAWDTVRVSAWGAGPGQDALTVSAFPDGTTVILK